MPSLIRKSSRCVLVSQFAPLFTPAASQTLCAPTGGTSLLVALPSWRTRRKRSASRTLRAAQNPGTYRARTNPRANRTEPPANRRHRRPLTSSRSVRSGGLGGSAGPEASACRCFVMRSRTPKVTLTVEKKIII